MPGQLSLRFALHHQHQAAGDDHHTQQQSQPGDLRSFQNAEHPDAQADPEQAADQHGQQHRPVQLRFRPTQGAHGIAHREDADHHRHLAQRHHVQGGDQAQQDKAEGEAGETLGDGSQDHAQQKKPMHLQTHATSFAGYPQLADRTVQ